MSFAAFVVPFSSLCLFDNLFFLVHYSEYRLSEDVNTDRAMLVGFELLLARVECYHFLELQEDQLEPQVWSEIVHHILSYVLTLSVMLTILSHSCFRVIHEAWPRAVVYDQVLQSCRSMLGQDTKPSVNLRKCLEIKVLSEHVCNLVNETCSRKLYVLNWI